MVLTLAIAILALLAGLAVGWLARAGAAAKAEAQAAELAPLRAQLGEVTVARDTALRELAAERATASERTRSFEAQMTELREAKDALSAQFNEVGAKLLADAQRQFLERADQRFAQANEKGEAQLKALLQPVETTLKRYEEGLQRVEKERIDHYAGLKSVVEQVREGQGKVRDETRNLVNALRSSPKARGRWGEQSLRNVLTQAGLVEGVDFEMEVSVNTEDGRLRPDVVVNLPSDRKLVIDAKCSLNAFLEACEEVDDEKRLACFQAHVASMRTHVQQLGSKAYWAQFGDAADYVVMYIPGEHFLTAALEQDPNLWEWAFERKVLLATPTNLVAIARTVATVWKQEKLAAEAGKIAELGKELHSRLATMAEHVASVGTNLGRMNNAYNKMVGSLESQVLTQARRFEDYGAGSPKEIPEPPVIEASPRTLTKLPVKDDEPIEISLDDPTLPRLEPADEEDEADA